MIGWRIRRKLAAARHARRRRGPWRAPFSADARRRLLILSLDHRIPQSQIFPFHFFAEAIRARFGTEIREVEAGAYLAAGGPLPKGADTVCFQTAFDIGDEALGRLVETIRRRNPGARLVYLDWFAPTDLRLAHRVGPLVDIYVTKHLLRDRARYAAPVEGDTTLMEHYGRRFGLGHPTTRFPIPPGFWDKLLLGPSFVTADFILPALARPGARPPAGARPIDLHARLATEGSPWYAMMRAECAAAVTALGDVVCRTGTGIGHPRFLSELRRSKICFSPFGYGEVCWRDFEAVLCGAVLLKQDMSHVATDPDIFVAGETYVPLRWDLADFEDRVRWLMADAAARRRIAGAAFERLADYVRSARFLDQMAPVLG
ncbi:MAG: hypothetical protein Kow0058_18060 [Roseovarius sp.]